MSWVTNDKTLAKNCCRSVQKQQREDKREKTIRKTIEKLFVLHANAINLMLANVSTRGASTDTPSAYL